MTTQTPQPAPEPLMTIDDLATYLAVAPTTIRDWRHDGRGPAALRVGGALRWRRTAVDAWLEGQQAGDRP